MDFVLVFPLILASISGTEQTNDSCYKSCPPGYYRTGACDLMDKEHRCKICPEKTYTDVPNFTNECLRCSVCGADQVEKKPCTTQSNVECECEKDHYYDKNKMYCKSCQKKDNDNDDYTRKCTSMDPGGKGNRTTNTTGVISTPTANTSLNPMPWMFLIAVMVIAVCVVLCGILLLCTRYDPGKANSYPCWNTNKDPEPHAEDTQFNEQRSHQGSSPTTLTFTISEETPMMALNHCPARAQNPAHIGPLLPNADCKAVRRVEQPERWPAVVLYAIIKEVPLRRWKEFLRLLSVADQQLERVELEAGLGLGSMERQYQMLRLWSQRSTASLNDVFSALHYMDLSGCAQQLQESLEKL